jgi:glutathione S-transferase
MSLILWSHPYSGYGQKVHVALYELGLPFEMKIIDGADPDSLAGFAKVSPFGKMPVLVDPDHGPVVETSIIIEHLNRIAGGGLVPTDPDAQLECRLIDRIVDTYVGGPMNRTAANRLRPLAVYDPTGAEADERALAQAWDWLEARLSDGRTWGAGDTFTLADCGAAPLLTYGRRIVDFGDRPRLEAWHARLLERPSFRRALEDAAPYGDLMPMEPGSRRA